MDSRLQVEPVSGFRWDEVRSLTRLAVPVALGELGWMAMSTVDLIMAGQLGPAAIGAIGVGNSAFYTFAIMGTGLLLGLDTLVSQAYGAGDRDDCHRSLAQGLYLALLIAAPLTGLFWCMRPIFSLMGVDAEVSGLASSYLGVLSFSMLPLAIYGALRRYLQGIGHVRPVMAALVTANLVNWFFNWLLIRGHWGFPALGVVGSALSTCLARLYMAALLAFSLWLIEHKSQPGLSGIWRTPELSRLRLLIRIGYPAALQILLEIGAFGTVGLLAGRLTQGALAAHQIALNCAAFSFMVPFGVSSAAAVAVGHAVGRREPRVARRAGYIAVGLSCVFMAGAAAVFLLFPAPLLRVYTNNVPALTIGAGLLAIAACFQLFDGIQVVFTGALRGLGETRVPMLVNFCGYWIIGLPLGYWLCFGRGFGVYGLWWGLTVALAIISTILWFAWARASRDLQL